MNFYKSPRGEDVVLNYLLNELDEIIRFKVLSAIDALDSDKTNSKGILITKLLRKAVWELKVRQVRVFYILIDGDVYIIHIIKKKSQKIEQTDIDIVLKRAKEIQNKKKNSK